MSRLAVAGIIRRHDGCLLFARRASMLAEYGGLWEFPGGAVHDGETSLEALRRELAEELGIVVAAPPILLRRGEVGGDNWLTEAYVVTAISGNPRIMEPRKCAELAYYPTDAPPKPLMPAARLDLQTLVEFNG